MNVLIADDEKIVLEGLKYIIDWNALGFTICQTALDGQDALDKILSLNPDLVLIDIRMPKRNGVEVVQAAVEHGYTGKFIILSGVTDFKLAQTAMRYGVDFYLTKPLDEEELEQAVRSVRESIRTTEKNQTFYEQYRDKAKQSILHDIMTNTCDYKKLDLDDLHLYANIYQVISYENYNQDYFYQTWNFADLMRVTNQDGNTFDLIQMGERRVILLKGDFAISRFENLLRHYQITPQKGSPFDSVFLAYGQKVSRIRDIHLSYEDICRLEGRRFFCQENQHVIGWEELYSVDSSSPKLLSSSAASYADRICRYIQSSSQTLISETLKELTDLLMHSDEDITTIKHFLIDIYILVKQKIIQLYPNIDIPFLANASAIDLIERKYYLYEIITFLAEQFDMQMHSVGYSSGENVMDEVLHYIHHNYRDNLKLETIAPLFGYSSSYLGKVFNKKMGVNFNSYVNQVRIKEAKKLLEQDTLKVYEIAEQVGYSNVDYFHKKFKKYTGTSPAEYRKNEGITKSSDEMIE